jgi:tRNA-splicing ligase RtcB (3'-phosphate/5'-hydroxy nucleic acid ligase)
MIVTQQPGARPIKQWTEGVEVEPDALAQVQRAAALPFVWPHVAVMPDVHVGIGATVGSVIPTIGAIVPACAGVDLGCGCYAVRTSLKASDLPDSLAALRSDIEAAVPHGRTDNGGPNDRGRWNHLPPDGIEAWQGLAAGYSTIVERHPKIRGKGAVHEHLCTLGTGNHFIEICLDEEQRVWVMLHSGSRGVGNKIGSYFIERAREEMRRWFINLPDVDLAYLPEGSELFDDYVTAVGWAQDFATANRALMMQATLTALQKHAPAFTVGVDEQAVQCHHNYIAKEHHAGKNVWVTRKGAVRARLGDMGIIPGSMGAKSFIVRGRGNADSLHSCSHGAGRKMSRTQANKTFTLEDHAAATAGVECRKDSDVIDETPGAYKSIDAVMAAQSDLVEIVFTLKQILCVKG